MTNVLPIKRKHENLEFGQQCSQKDIAEAWGVTPARIGQIERRAIAKIRQAIARFAAEEGVSEQEWLFG